MHLFNQQIQLIMQQNCIFQLICSSLRSLFDISLSKIINRVCQSRIIIPQNKPYALQENYYYSHIIRVNMQDKSPSQEQQPPKQIQTIKPVQEIQDNSLQPKPSRLQQDFNCVSRLQRILKQEYLLLTTQQEQKSSFQKKLHSTLFSYYRSMVSLGESTYHAIQQERTKLERSNSINSSLDKNGEKIEYQQERRLFEDQGFGDVYTFVKEVVLTLSKDPYLMMVLIEKYEHSGNIQLLTSLAKTIANSMYENIVDDDVFNKDLLKIIAFCLRKLTSDKKHYFQINFHEEGFCHLIFQEIIERGEIKSYAKQIIKNTLLQIAKVDHIIDFRRNDQEDKLMPDKILKMMHKQSSKSAQQSPIKANGYQPKTANKKSKLKVYSDGLRQYDQRLRKGSIIKRKYRNCVSDELLNYLGINEQINFPCFSCSSSEQMKIQQQINKQLGLMINRSQVKNENSFHPDSLILKNIVLIFFNDLFKMLYSMPPLIRISCKMLYRYLNLRFNSKNSLYVVADFVINFWLTSCLHVDVLVAEATKLSPYLQQNLQEVILVIKKIVKDNSKDINQGFVKQFHLIVTNLKVSIANYINEVINIDNQKINSICEELQDSLAGRRKDLKEGVNCIKSYCVCMSMTDIRRLLQLIKGAEKQLGSVNQRIFKRVLRIQMMSSDVNIFGDKKDKVTKKIYKASKSFALFTDLALPSHLSIDYNKHYRDAFKQNKVKNVMKQVLLSLADIKSFEQFFNANSLQDFFFSLDIRQGMDCLNSIDRIPLRLKIQYLQIITRQIKLAKIIQQLEQQTLNRFSNFKNTWRSSKECYLKAISSINFQNQKLIAKQLHIRGEIKRRKLEEFFAKNQIKLCLTSPKTRQKQIILKTTLMKDIIEEYRQRLWLQNQSRCIHTALNLDFIKSLTGQPEKQKMKYESHFSNIMKFSQILCSLPEVKQRFSLSEDTIGIKQVFFEFIDFIKNFIRSKEQEYSILLENTEWLQQNIELKISKRLYDKLYPKYPLYDDIALYLRLKTLDWISFEHFKIDEQLRNRKVWEVAAANLRMIDKLRTAAEKLHCIEQTTRIISNNYLLMSKNQGSASADDISPLMIIVLIMAAPKRLISSINFIQSFASPSKLLSKEGYCFTQLKGAVHFCDTVSSMNLNLFSNEAANYIEFNRKIYQKQIQYGIYFMLGRRTESPQTEKQKLQYLKQYFRKVQI